VDITAYTTQTSTTLNNFLFKKPTKEIKDMQSECSLASDSSVGDDFGGGKDFGKAGNSQEDQDLIVEEEVVENQQA